MKKLILLICMLAGMSSCYHEDALIVPEQPDKYNILTDDPSDPTQHFIYQFYQKYQTVIITNPTEADYKFNFTANNGIKITAPEQKQEIIDEGIEFLQKVLLNLYSDSFLKKNLPFSILLSEEVRMASYGETTIMNCYASSSFIALGNVSSSLKTMTDEEFVKIRADVNATFGQSICRKSEDCLLFQMLFMKLVKKLNRNCTTRTGIVLKERTLMKSIFISMG